MFDIKIPITPNVNRAVIPVVIALIYYCFSLYLLDLNIEGDQKYYHILYKMLEGARLSEILKLQHATVGGSEPLYGGLMWIGANLNFNKIQYISLFNALFAASLFVLLKKYRVPLVLILLLLSNYYFIVLFTSAERLKFSYIVMIIAAIFSGNLRPFIASFALFFHFQTFINAISILFGLIRLPQLSAIKLTKQTLSLSLVAGLVIVSVTFVIDKYFYSAIVNKFLGYASRAEGVNSIINIILLLIIGLLITKQYKKFILLMFPIIVAVFILGSARANMIGFVMFFYQIMKEHRTNHPLMYLLLMYFSFKSYSFIMNIILYGTGY